MSVDRLDYSKGLVERFRAFEKLLEHQPAQRNNVSFVQIAPPTRADMDTYKDIRLQLEAESGRINGRYAELDWTPIRYIHRQYERPVLAALFHASHVGFVTPLRDGMNLVAKEYVAAQDPDDPGVLVLSQFAGAAQELNGALIVNPLDIAGMADALAAALAMPLAERKARHAEMFTQLRENNVSVWRDNFMRDLQA
jgi:trehalose 6-phosphate synthase